MYIFNYLDNII